MTDSVEGLILEGGVLAATVIGMTVAGVWKISTIKDDLRKEFGDDISALTKQVTETLTAMREKIVQVEFYVRDNYVSKETFSIVTERILAELRSASDKFDNRCTALENKIITYLYDSRKADREQP